MKQVSIIGASVVEDSKHYNDAYEYGRFLARKGFVMICGGKGGFMEAVSKGVFDGGGISVCLLPEVDRRYANDYCKIVIPTGFNIGRNLPVVLSGDVVVAFGGGAGTLSEMAFAWQFGKKIIAASWIEGYSKYLSGKKIDKKRDDFIISAMNLEELYRWTEKILMEE